MKIANLEMIAITLLCSSACAIGKADEELAKKPTQQIEMQRVDVLVVDEAGNPVADAKVIPIGFRTKVERGSHYGWAERHGPQAKAQTDERGMATLNVPKFVYEQLEIGEVTWLVDHYNFVAYNHDHLVEESPAKIVLKSGYRIAATAVNAETKQRIKDHLFAVLAGNSFEYDWRMKSGVVVSRVFDVDRSTLRLVHLPPDGKAMFSKLLSVKRPTDADRAFLKNVELNPGTRVSGSLHESVPRPVKRGSVIAFVGATINPSDTNYRNVWTWNDKTEVAEDGSFVFESLPDGDLVQLIGTCEGWVSKSPTQKEIDSIIPWKQSMRGGRQLAAGFPLKR